jgi:hypothetical protein
MIRRVSTLVITILLAGLTTAAPAYAGGTTFATPLGDFHCC